MADRAEELGEFPARCPDLDVQPPGQLRPAGLGAWISTVAVGMLLRVVSGQGTAAAFIVVALAFLGLFMLGWRLLAGRFTTWSSG